MVELRILVVSLLYYIAAFTAVTKGASSCDIDLRAIDARFEKLINEINRLKDRENEQQRKFDLVTAELDSHKKMLDEHKKKVKVLESLVNIPTKEHEELDVNIKSAVQSGDQTNYTVKSIAQNETFRKRRQDVGAPIAFFALLDNHLTHAGIHQDVVFEKVVTNEGGSYSPLLGTFTAPVPGTYVFSVTLTAYSTITSHFTISKNHTPVSWLIVHGQAAQNAVASQTDILVLQKGDFVNVQNQDADKNLNGYLYSSFAGFLLHENEPMPVIG